MDSKKIKNDNKNPRNRRNSEERTETKDAIYNYLIDFTLKHGYQPNTREISEHFNFSSSESALRYIKELESEGKVRRHHSSRCVEVVGFKEKAEEFRSFMQDSEVIKLPVVAEIQKGIPIYSDKSSYISVDIVFNDAEEKNYDKDNYFLYIVPSDDMGKIGLSKNDSVVVKKITDKDKTANLNDGDTLVVMVLGNPFICQYNYSNSKDLICITGLSDELYIPKQNIIGKVIKIIKNP